MRQASPRERASRRAFTFGGLALAAGGARAQDAAEFFRGRTVTIHVGYAAGGGYDLYCRLVAAHLGRHLPGNPQVVVRNEPGAGSFRLANDLYARFPREGLDLGMFGEVLNISQMLGDPQAKFVAREFTWIGRVADSDPVMVTRPDSGVVVFADALTRELIVGVPGAGSATGFVLDVANRLMGARFKLVLGYEGSAQIRLALERGEVQASSSTLWSVDKSWIRENRYNVIWQLSHAGAPDLPDTPSLAALGRDEDERRLLAFFTSYTTFGRSIVAPPGVPTARVAALRASLDAALADPALVADANRQNLRLAPLSGDRLARLMEDATSLDARLLARARALRDAGASAR